MISHSFTAKRDSRHRGWIGIFTYPCGDANHVAQVRNADGLVRLFPSEIAASTAAAHALCHALNSSRSRPTGRHFAVSRQHGKAFLIEQANKIFSGSSNAAKTPPENHSRPLLLP